MPVLGRQHPRKERIRRCALGFVTRPDDGPRLHRGEDRSALVLQLEDRRVRRRRRRCEIDAAEIGPAARLGRVPRLDRRDGLIDAGIVDLFRESSLGHEAHVCRSQRSRASHNPSEHAARNEVTIAMRCGAQRERGEITPPYRPSVREDLTRIFGATPRGPRAALRWRGCAGAAGVRAVVRRRARPS